MPKKNDQSQAAQTGNTGNQPPSNSSAQTSHGRTRNDVIDNVTDYYIDDLKKNPRNITPEQIATELTLLLEEQFDLENAMRPRGMSKYRPPLVLPPDVIAELMTVRYHIQRISCAGIGADEEYDLIGMYVDEGANEGIYTTSEVELMKVARRFNRRLAKKDFDEVLFTLKALIPRTERCMNRDLIAVNNGIFDYSTKTLLPFTPDLVFLAKSHIDYNPLAQNVVIHNPSDGTDWDLISWIHEISDDSDIETLLWQIMGAVIRPYVRWNKSAWLYAEDGNNGKGTFCEMMQNLCGDGTYASIPIINFGKEFMLEPLVHSTAIIVHENATGKFIDDVANLKAVITNDVIPINRKHKQPINFQFYGFMVQCLNEMPRIRDKSDSFYRRQLFVPFSKSYTGIERKYIKDDYIKRTEVLEYALYRVLNMNYYELSEPVSCRQVLEEYKEYNDPVRQFMNEMSDQFKWDLLPFQFLYDLYKSWFKRNIPSGTLQSKSKFIQELLNVIKKGSQWYCRDKNKNIRSDKRISGPEPLIFEYELTTWYNKTYTGSNPDIISTIVPNQFYRGILRVTDQTATDDDSDAETNETEVSE